MDAALAASAFLMGLAGAPHCALMCGAPCAAVVGRPGATGLRPALSALSAARLIGYSCAGALIAAGSAGIADLASARMLQPLWTLVHVGAIALGAWLIWKARPPAWLDATPSRAGLANTYRAVRVFRSLPASGRAGIAGLCWVAIPCGLLQSALLVAALASGPLGGAMVMAAFAAASSAGLWFGPEILRRIGTAGGGERATGVALRLAGLLLVASSLFAVGHGLGDALCRAFD